MRKMNLKNHYGFTLVEMAVVMVILGLVIGSLLLPLEAQRQQVFLVQTQNQLDTIQKALIGFAQANGRLPCPAIYVDLVNDRGTESPLGGGTCTTLDGYVPAATLGIRPTDDKSYAVDAWNYKIRYAITNANHATLGATATPDFTTSGDMNSVGLSNLAPDMRVCATSTGITATACSGGTESNYLTNNAVAVIYSTGSTAANGAGDADETANLDGDKVFVSHDPSGTFDHQVIWISPYVLYDAMIKAGQIR